MEKGTDKWKTTKSAHLDRWERQIKNQITGIVRIGAVIAIKEPTTSWKQSSEAEEYISPLESPSPSSLPTITENQITSRETQIYWKKSQKNNNFCNER